jgi:hypothetical protein
MFRYLCVLEDQYHNENISCPESLSHKYFHCCQIVAGCLYLRDDLCYRKNNGANLKRISSSILAITPKLREISILTDPDYKPQFFHLSRSDPDRRKKSIPLGSNLEAFWHACIKAVRIYTARQLCSLRIRMMEDQL